MLKPLMTVLCFMLIVSCSSTKTQTTEISPPEPSGEPEVVSPDITTESEYWLYRETGVTYIVMKTGPLCTLSKVTVQSLRAGTVAGEIKITLKQYILLRYLLEQMPYSDAGAQALAANKLELMLAGNLE